MYTIRQCINELRKVPTSQVFLQNGTTIYIFEKDPVMYESISKVRIINGQKILRKIFCEIEPSERTKGLEELKKKFWMFAPNLEYNYFREKDYCINEREMNIFISLNGGIDYYRTLASSRLFKEDSRII